MITTGEKLIALRVNSILAPIAARTVADPQRGFVIQRNIADDIVGLDGAMSSLSLLLGCRAAALLFDFANAFPALCHDWIFAVLVAMGLPSRLIAIIRMLYHDFRTETIYGGAVVTTISLHSGIRQGCRLSGTMFALSLDPFVRWYLSRSIFNGSYIFLYADDLANAFRDVYQQLPLILRALLHWRRASGLSLKPSKCVVLPLWVGDYSDIKNFVGNLPGFTTDVVRSSARYLGVELGVNSCAAQWLSVAPRITQRAHDIRNAGASLPSRVALHNTHVASMIRYRATLFPPSQELLRTYRHSAQIVLNTPWQAIPAPVLHDMRGLGFQSDLVDIAVTCEASLLYQAVTNPAVHRAWNDYEAIRDSDDAALAIRRNEVCGRAWHRHNSSTRIMRMLYERHCAMPRFMRTLTSTRRDAMTYFRPDAETRHDASLRVLQRRVMIWEPEVPEALVGSYLHFSSLRPPVEVLSACLRSLCNAWCTASRFGNPPAHCPFGCGSARGDRQSHLLACPVFLHWLDLHLYCSTSPPDVSVAGYIRRLGAPFPVCMLSAISLDIAIWAADRVRRGSTLAPRILFAARLKELVLRHVECKNALR